MLEVFVTARGVAYVDLSKEAAQRSRRGSEDELITVYSVVNSLTIELPGGQARADPDRGPAGADAGRPRGPDAPAAARHDLLRRPPRRAGLARALRAQPGARRRERPRRRPRPSASPSRSSAR